MTELLFEVRQQVDGGFVASALEASIFAEADSFALLKRSIRDAVKCHFEPQDSPASLRLIIIREETIELNG